MSENLYPPDPAAPITPPPPPNPAAPTPPPAAPQPPAPAMASYAPTTPPTEPLAIWALLCAIGAWVLLPVVLAIVALVLAHNAEKEITRADGWKQGKGMVTAARLIAWIHLVLAALAIVFVVTFLIGLAIGS
ncbi:MAG: DUF4190 domain-containing protein [Candidatus Nanopelagicales bacterium]